MDEANLESHGAGYGAASLILESPSRPSRERPTRPAGATKASGKSELVRGFFETVRQREA